MWQTLTVVASNMTSQAASHSWLAERSEAVFNAGTMLKCGRAAGDRHWRLSSSVWVEHINVPLVLVIPIGEVPVISVDNVCN